MSYAIYQCPDCNRYYTTSSKIDNLVEKCTHTEVSRVIVECVCGHKHGIGGEYENGGMFGDEPAIMMFGFSPEQVKDLKDIPILPAHMLEETTENKAEASTYDGGLYGNPGRVIYLKKEDKK